MKKIILYSFLLLAVNACQSSNEGENEIVSTQNPSISERVSTVNEALQKKVNSYYTISLDHHKMAQEEGVYTPPAIATIFSDPEINTPLIQANPLIGIDLPFKTLVYSEPDTGSVYLAFTSADFITKRHGLNSEQLMPFQHKISQILDRLDGSQLSSTSTDSVSKGYGIIQIESDFDYSSTIENLKNVVNAQSDTRWFGEIDFQKDAEVIGQKTLPATLLLFGGPAPGGKAMMSTPKIGLDAFCQKLLVFQNEDGQTWIAFNDIVAFSNLYYGTATKPQIMINKRLIATFTQAIKKDEQLH